MRVLDIDKDLANLGALFRVCGRAFFDVAADIDHIVEIVRCFFELFGQFHHGKLHQRRAADRFLHPQLATLHAAGQVDFAFASEQRHSAHFAQIHADGVVCIYRLFDRLLMRMKKIRFRFRIEELCRLFFEIDPYRSFS